MNILIKLTCLVGLVIAPILGEIYGGVSHSAANTEVIEQVVEKKEIKVTIEGEDEENLKAEITITDGEETETKTVTGTKAEIEAAIEENK